MNLIALEIPGDLADLPAWLDRRVVGEDLAPLVAQLEAVNGPRRKKTLPLDRVLGDQRPRVMSEGLKALSADRLRWLLIEPKLLFDLQDLVLLEGGDHWLDQPKTAEEQRRSTDFQARLFRKIETPEPEEEPEPILRRIGRFAVLAAAASVMLFIAYSVYRDARTTEPWGWNRPEAVATAATDGRHLNYLADLAAEWFDRRPRTQAAVEDRLTALRRGCSILINAEHPQLKPEERAWLLDRCKQWAATFDEQLAALKSGRDPLAVRDDVDATVNRLVNALRTRAAALSRA